MRLFFTLAILPLFVVITAAQPSVKADDCLPNSLVSTDYPVNADALERLFAGAQDRAELTPQGFEALKTRISRCNNDVEVTLSGLLSQMSELSLKYQQILGYKDVEGIEKQLRDLEESRKKSKAELEQNLGYVKHSGIFVVLLEGVVFYNNEQKDRIADASRAVTNRAVEDLVGVHIRRSSEVRNFAPVRDVVQGIKSGEIRMEREYFNQPNPLKKQFLFVGRFGATPARQKPVGSDTGPTGALVLNLDVDTDFRARLMAKGVKEADILRIEQEVMPFLPNVQRDNKTANGRQDYILQNGAEEIRRIDRDIEDARLRLDTRSAKIGEICRELGVPFANGNFNQAVNAALQKIRDQIRALTIQWNQTAGREIVYKDARTSLEGSLTQSLAAEALKLCSQIEKGYGQLDRILQVTEVENFDVTRFENSRTVTVFRTPKKIWAYAIPRDDGAYGVAVLVQFQVTDVAGQKDTNRADTSSQNRLEPPTPVEKKADDQKTENKLPFEPATVPVDAGKYQRGQYWVRLDSYRIGKTEITYEQFVAFLNDISGKIRLDNLGDVVSYGGATIMSLSEVKEQIEYSGGAWAGGRFIILNGYNKYPVTMVSWEGAMTYCKWLSSKTGKRYSLPTEAQWEYAALGGKKSKGFEYAGSDNLKDVGWQKGKPSPVALKTPNELGLYDMSGNVREWCYDFYKFYPAESQVNPSGPEQYYNHLYERNTYLNRVLRGGSCESSAKYCRTTERDSAEPDTRKKDVGFRVAQQDPLPRQPEELDERRIETSPQIIHKN